MIRPALDAVRAAPLHAKACYGVAALCAATPFALAAFLWAATASGPLEAGAFLFIPPPWLLAVAFWALGRIATDVARRADAAERLAAAERGADSPTTP